VKHARFPSSLPEQWPNLSDRAKVVHFEATCWCAEEQTDGHITFGQAKVWNLKVCNELSSSGLWVTLKDGYRIVDYLKSNPKASAVERERAAARERMRRIRGRTPEVAKPSRPAKVRHTATVGQGADGSGTAHPPPPPEAVALCDLLADLIEGNGSKRPTVTEKWKNEARLMLERDGRPYEEAEELIRWAQADPFWNSNVMSMPKFRMRYDQLRIKARNGGGHDRAQEIFDDADASEEDRGPAGSRVQGTLLPPVDG
jgi:hypothetical protein